MGHCMTVLILSTTIFLLLFSITIPSINSIECQEKDGRIQTCTKYQMCFRYVDRGRGDDDYKKSFSSCVDESALPLQEPGCYHYETQDKWNIDCYCTTNKCNEGEIENQLNHEVECAYYDEHSKYHPQDHLPTLTNQKRIRREMFGHIHRIKNESMCYFKHETDVESGNVITVKAGTMNNEYCQSLNIPDGQECTRKYDNNHGQGPLKDIIECCCKAEWVCNYYEDKDVPQKGIEPLKCFSFPESKEKYCDTTYIDPICWYQEKQDMATKEPPSQTGYCVDKIKHKECNTITENTCKRSNDKNTAITTVDCCCKQNECNTQEGLASQLAQQPIPLRCYDFDGKFDNNVQKWCKKDEICLYQEKLQMTRGGAISVRGHCAQNDPHECRAGFNACNRMPRDIPQNGMSEMDCCCNSTLCNAPEEQKKYYQPPKEIKCYHNMTADKATNSQWCMNENQICLLQSQQVLGVADTVITWKGECTQKANSDKLAKKPICHKDAINKCIRSLNKDDPNKSVSQVDCCCDTENCNNHKNSNFTIPKLDVLKCLTFKQGETAVSKFCKGTDEICWYKSTQTLGMGNGKVQEEGKCVELEQCPQGIMNGTCNRQQNKDNTITTVDCCCNDGHDCNDPAKLKDKIPPVPTLPPTTPEPTEEELDTAAPEETAAAATRVQLKVVTIIAMLIAIVQHL